MVSHFVMVMDVLSVIRVWRHDGCGCRSCINQASGLLVLDWQQLVMVLMLVALRFMMLMVV